MPGTLTELLPEYLAYRKNVAAVSDSTLSNDKISVQYLIKACGDIRPVNITMQHVERLSYLLAEGKTPATYNVRLAGCRQFLAWCRARGEIKNDPLALVRTRANPKPDRHRVPVTEFPRLLDAARHPRDRMIIAMGLWLFLRASEIRSLRLRDIDLENAEVHVYIQKTKDYDIMPISAYLESELRRWLTWYTEHARQKELHCEHPGCGPLCEDWYLLPSKAGSTGRDSETGQYLTHPDAPLRPTRPIDRHAQDVVKRALRLIGHPTYQEGCHTLRRSGARAYFDQLVTDGYDGALKMVSAMLHHASVTMTERYLGIREDRHRRNKRIKGQVFFAAIEAVPDNVTPLTLASEG